MSTFGKKCQHLVKMSKFGKKCQHFGIGYIYRVHIWNHHEKSIQISTNMPGFVALVGEVAVKISLREQTRLSLSKTNVWVQNVITKLWIIYHNNSKIKIISNFSPSARLHKTADLDPSKNYLLAYHPHGIMSIGAFVNFSTEGTGFSELFPGITSYLLMLKLVFSFPLVREYFLSAGKQG